MARTDSGNGCVTLSPDMAILPPTKKVPLTREQALQRKRELAVQRRAARRAAGLCAQCGAQPPALDKALCAVCAKHESDRWHRQRKGLKSRRQAAAKPVAKPKSAAAKPAAIPGNASALSLPPCVICRGRLMNERAAATQMAAAYRAAPSTLAAVTCASAHGGAVGAGHPLGARGAAGRRGGSVSEVLLMDVISELQARLDGAAECGKGVRLDRDECELVSAALDFYRGQVVMISERQDDPMMIAERFKV